MWTSTHQDRDMAILAMCRQYDVHVVAVIGCARQSGCAAGITGWTQRVGLANILLTKGRVVKTLLDV